MWVTNILVDGYRTHAVGIDMAAGGVLDILDVPLDMSLNS
jgi:hypothetical protein